MVMIFYFTGTGNSLYVAKDIASSNGENLVSISSELNKTDEFCEYNLKENEIVGFVFPIHAWGPPKMVLNFIAKLKFNNYRNNYVFTAATCGGNIGNTMKVIDNRLKVKGIILNSGFSIKMPNNFILMGDVDSKEIEEEKLLSADKSLIKINNTIRNRETGVFTIEKGFLPWLLTGLINPLFNKNASDTRKFHVKDTCIKCGTCEKVCNCRNIKLSEKPQWGKHCSQCLACIHYCPVRAIQYGNATEKKGRYTNPNISVL
jgi:flavodoxin/NAD-dependent dihydropyrimidine dehydrogenase PreA subunit